MNYRREPVPRLVELQIDDRTVTVPEETTLLAACKKAGIKTPTLCYLENLTPVNVCRVCVVEVEGSRTLVPACSRRVEAGMMVHTDSERVRHSRRMVLEFLASSVDLSLVPEAGEYLRRYGAEPDRYGDAAQSRNWRPGSCSCRGTIRFLDGEAAGTVQQPVKVDNELFVRDYSRCILCYKWRVEACGTDA